jgi:peptidoglycan/LPS O-acetylase OafA/YrhL
MPGLDLLVRSGSTGVSLFLVLSGFCLYLPFAAGRQGRFHTGRFLLRRCRRLLPAYYVSLAATMVLTLAAGTWLGLEHLTPAEALWQIGTHVTMLHTVFPSTFYAVNGAYWSLGLEWQLYLALPLLVLMAARFGLGAAAGLAVGVNVFYRVGLWMAETRGWVPGGTALADAVLPNLIFGRWAEFAYGMIAAELYASGRVTSGARWLRWLRWAPVVLVPTGFLFQASPLSHLVFGAVFMVVLLVVLAGDNPVSSLLSWRPLAAIGGMSYSLYLVHQPLVVAMAHLLRTAAGMPPSRTFAALLALLPAILGVAWVLFQTVERLTLTERRRAPEPRRSDRLSLAEAPQSDAAAVPAE